jgi:competence protein ComFC
MFKIVDAVLAKVADLLGFIFGATCPACGRIATTLCNSCRDSLWGGDTEKISPTEYHGDVLVAFEYNSTIRKAILAFKYRNQRSSLRFLGDALVHRVRIEQSRSLEKIDLVTWAPTTQRRIVERGYDHAELIAKYVAKRLQVPCEKV